MKSKVGCEPVDIFEYVKKHGDSVVGCSKSPIKDSITLGEHLKEPVSPSGRLKEAYEKAELRGGSMSLVTVDYRQVRCDCCGRVQDVKNIGEYLPKGWFELEVSQHEGGGASVIRLKQECCSETCVVAVLQKTKFLPEPPKTQHLILSREDR